jgi:hypothetical protein
MVNVRHGIAQIGYMLLAIWVVGWTVLVLWSELFRNPDWSDWPVFLAGLIGNGALAYYRLHPTKVMWARRLDLRHLAPDAVGDALGGLSAFASRRSRTDQHLQQGTELNSPKWFL